MNIDNNGLSFFNETNKGEEINFKLNGLDIKSDFYKLIDNSNYIIKKSFKGINSEALLNMLSKFNEINNKIILTDLPVSYYIEDNKIVGSVIPYYEDSENLYNISITKDLNNLMKVYKRDDDNIHNLFILYSEIIDIIEELYDNGVCYYDSNSTNFVFKDNKVHLIDFDPGYIKFNTRRKATIQTLSGIDDLADRMNGRFLSYDEWPYLPRNFNKLRKHMIKIENRVRKR